MNDHIAHLEQLLLHPGWQYFEQSLKRHWNEELGSYVRLAASESDGLRALEKVRQIVVARDAVDRALQWPTDELRRLRAQLQHDHPSSRRA